MPSLPNGRNRISMRNTKPSSVTSSNAAITFLPSLLKKSWLLILLTRLLVIKSATPTVSPACSKLKIKSTSDDTLSSPPPSLPMPTMINCCSWFVKLLGWPKVNSSHA